MLWCWRGICAETVGRPTSSPLLLMPGGVLKWRGRLACWILEPRPELELVLLPHRYPLVMVVVVGRPIMFGSIRAYKIVSFSTATHSKLELVSGFVNVKEKENETKILTWASKLLACLRG